MDICALCRDDVTITEGVTTGVCGCKMLYHSECLDELRNYGFDCPICHKSAYTLISNSQNYYDGDQLIDPAIINIMENFLNKYQAQPNIITFGLFLFSSILFTCIVLIPTLMHNELFRKF